MTFMNVTIIYGTTSKVNTYNSVQLLLNNLSLSMNIKVAEFFLPKDLPSFNRGCFSCLINGAEGHFHVNYVDTIVKSLDDSDLIILASPVFICDISADMKSFLEHLSYKYMQKKTSSSLNNKIGLVMSTATGAGLSNTTKTLKKHLTFLGINNIFTFSETVYEMNLKDVKLKTKIHINKKISKLSNNILDLYIKSYSIKASILSKIIFSPKRTLLKEYDCNIIDLNHWKKQACFHSKN